MKPEQFEYWYKVTVVRVYDGDTIWFDWDYGFNKKELEVSTRLYGLDTPEVRGPEREEGLKVRDLVREKLPVGKEVVVRSEEFKKGKYGRPIVTVFVDGLNLNEWLIENGHARRVDY